MILSKTDLQHSHLVSEYFRVVLLRRQRLVAECGLTDDPHEQWWCLNTSVASKES